MESIFELFLKKEIPGDTPILEAYAKVHDIKKTWLSVNKNLTIQELVDQICDDLESQGYDLSSTPITEIKQRFALHEIIISAPKEYLQLKEAKDQAESSLKSLHAHNVPEEYITQVNSMISLLETKMKELS